VPIYPSHYIGAKLQARPGTKYVLYSTMYGKVRDESPLSLKPPRQREPGNGDCKFRARSKGLRPFVDATTRCRWRER